MSLWLAQFERIMLMRQLLNHILETTIYGVNKGPISKRLIKLPLCRRGWELNIVIQFSTSFKSNELETNWFSFLCSAANLLARAIHGFY